jgi:hypothetical protein
MNHAKEIIAEIKKRGIPMLDEQDDKEDPIVYLEMRLLNFWWRWFVTECKILNNGDILFFGYVAGSFDEWGHFCLSELTTAGSILLVNPNFEPKPFSEVKKELNL